MRTGAMAGRKLFVGSLPDGVSDDVLRAAFGPYGQLEEVYVKANCAPGQQCAFVTFASGEQAQYAKESTDRILTLPGSLKACEVMVAKNQGTHGQQAVGGLPRFSPPGPVHGFAGGPRATGAVMGAGGAFGQAFPHPGAFGAPQGAGAGGGAQAPKKIHVGSLPDDIQEEQLQEEFSRFGTILEIYLKQGCESGRQWAFITFASSAEAAAAKQNCDRILTFPTSLQACEVVFARNQDLPQGCGSFAAPQMGMASSRAAPFSARPDLLGFAPAADGPKKIMVGSLPDGISEVAVKATFSAFGRITDVYVKPNCEPGRQWAFVTYATHHEAKDAKTQTDRLLALPGAIKPCEVMFARSETQAPFQQAQAAFAQPAAMTPAQPAAPNKIFVGSMPGNVSDHALRAEFERFGTILDVYIKPEGTCEPGRQWGFVTFSTPAEASEAKEQTDRLLFFPGSERPAEVMIAKGRGSPGGQAAGGTQMMHMGAMHMGATAHQPPPPNSPPPFDTSGTSWRLYYTNTGLPYYHNAATNKTMWERPSDLPPAFGAQGGRGGGGAMRRGPY